MQSQDERGLHTRTPGKGRVDEKKEVRQGTAGGSVRRRTANPRVPCARPGVSRLTAATERGGGRRREIQTRGRTWSGAARPRAGRSVSGRAVLSPRVGAGAALGGRSGGRGTPAPDTVPLRGQSSRPGSLAWFPPFSPHSGLRGGGMRVVRVAPYNSAVTDGCQAC